MDIIDPHLHFFALQEGNYSWLVGSTPPPWKNLDKIKQDHGLKDIQNVALFALKGIVHIEAGFDNVHPERELQWLEKTLGQFPFKAIAYCRIDAEPNEFLQRLEKMPKDALIGIRDITENEDYQRLLSPNVLANLASLSERSLIWEAQGHFGLELARKTLLKLALTCPALRIVVTHFGLLEESENVPDVLQELASAPNIWIKYSGQEMLSNPVETKKAFELLVATFGEDRIMLASNYPVCLQQMTYEKVWQHYLTSWPSPSSFNKVAYLNAKRCYGL